MRFNGAGTLAGEKRLSRTTRPFTTKAWVAPTASAPSSVMSKSVNPNAARCGLTPLETPQTQRAHDKGFRASTPDHLCHIVETRLAATCVELPRVGSIDAWANHCPLPSSELFFCAYGAPLKLKFSAGEYVRIQFQQRGAGATSVGKQVIPVTARQSCISSPEATIDFGDDFQQLVWRVPRDALIRKLAALTSAPVSRPIEFDGILPVSTPQSRQLMQVLSCLLATVQYADIASNRLLVAELEQALMVALLCCGHHTLQELLAGDRERANPWQVRRAEEFIESHLDQPLRIEEIAVTTGTSARSLHRAFRQSRGYSPMEFARRQRLRRALRMLQEPETESVTEVCFACGFVDTSHFSREFSKAFGESPSTILGRRALVQGTLESMRPSASARRSRR
jgi:AraC-like DNA-binding protein